MKGSSAVDPNPKQPEISPNHPFYKFIIRE